MASSLYDRLIETEKLNGRLHVVVDEFQEALKKFEGLPGYSPYILYSVPYIDISAVQRDLISKYENNPVLEDAIVGRMSIEDSLQELAQVNKGIRKILPRRKDKVHNTRLKHLNDLMPGTDGLQSYGILFPDNFFTAAIETTALAFVSTYAYAAILLPHAYINPTPELIAEQVKFSQTVMPAMFSVLTAPLIGLACNFRRFSSFGATLPVGEARYLDRRVQEFYR